MDGLALQVLLSCSALLTNVDRAAEHPEEFLSQSFKEKI